MGNNTSSKWYDSKEGIEKSLSSLMGFHGLLSARNEAGYGMWGSKERLDEFYVLGRYHLDAWGNCFKIKSDYIPAEKFPQIPNVLTEHEFWEYLKENAEENPNKISITSSMGSDLPPVRIACPVCNKKWSLENCHDTVVAHETKVFPLVDFVGQTLGAVKGYFAGKTDAVYRMQDDILIRHDRFIDLSPEYPDTTDNWQKDFVKNKMGWVGKSHGIDDDYVIRENDEGFFNVWIYYHESCHRLHSAYQAEQKFRDVFTKAGFRYFIFHHIPNQYYPGEQGSPWFTVETEAGEITLGWRKRVISIDWSKTFYQNKNLLALFPNEDTTKEATYIHAWGYDKAIGYLSKIRKELSV